MPNQTSFSFLWKCLGTLLGRKLANVGKFFFRLFIYLFLCLILCLACFVCFANKGSDYCVK